MNRRFEFVHKTLPTLTYTAQAIEGVYGEMIYIVLWADGLNTCSATYTIREVNKHLNEGKWIKLID